MLIDRDNIFLNKDFKTKEEIFHFLANHSVSCGWAESASDIENDLWQRENEYSTGLEGSIAIPHAKTQHVKQAGIIFIRLNQSIQWESLDGLPIQVIFGLFVPESGAKKLHLQIINELAGQLIDDEFREQLFTINSVDDMYSWFSSHISNMEGV